MVQTANDSPKGLVMIFTGQGKGKTTAALGAALRATGNGLKVLMIQFIKGGRSYGELVAAESLPGLEIRPRGLGLIGRGGGDLTPHRRAARAAWQEAGEELASGRWDMLILDEVFAALNRGFITQEELSQFIHDRPAGPHLVLTGRDCPPELQREADMVTEMRAVKHHLESGCPAQEGIEF